MSRNISYNDLHDAVTRLNSTLMRPTQPLGEDDGYGRHKTQPGHFFYAKNPDGTVNLMVIYRSGYGLMQNSRLQVGIPPAISVERMYEMVICMQMGIVLDRNRETSENLTPFREAVDTTQAIQ